MYLTEWSTFTNKHRKYLSCYNPVILEAWGFNEDQVEMILFYQNVSIFPEKPNQLESFAQYLNSPFRLSFTNTGLEDLPGFSDILSIDEDEEVEEISIPPTQIIGETAHDLQVKYKGTYGLHLEKPIFITDIYPNSNTPKGYKIDARYYNEDVSSTAFTSKDINEFQMIIPKLGFINHKNTTIFIERKHKKESPTRYRKGLRADNLIIAHPSSLEYKEVYGIDPYDANYYGTEQVLLRVLHSLFIPETYTYQEALDELLNFKKLSCAITSTISLSLNFKTNSILLRRNQFVIGAYSPKLKGFVMSTDLFNDVLIKSGVIIK
jgi:hypothetical protein